MKSLIAELTPLSTTDRQRLVVGRIQPLITACPSLDPVFSALSMASLEARCSVMASGFPPALKECGKPEVSQQLYMLLYQTVSPMGQPLPTTVTLTLSHDGEPLLIGDGDTWQTLYPQVLERDGGSLGIPTL